MLECQGVFQGFFHFVWFFSEHLLIAFSGISASLSLGTIVLYTILKLLSSTFFGRGWNRTNIKGIHALIPSLAEALPLSYSPMEHIHSIILYDECQVLFLTRYKGQGVCDAFGGSVPCPLCFQRATSAPSDKYDYTLFRDFVKHFFQKSLLSF